MYFKKIALFALSCFIIVIFFKTENYGTWLNGRILVFIDEFSRQSKDLSIEHRKEVRWGNAYVDGMNIKKYIDSSNFGDVVLLIPDNDYIKKRVPQADFPEPIVYYLLTGLKTVRPYSKNVHDANMTLLLDNQNISLHKINDKKQIDSLLAYFKK